MKTYKKRLIRLMFGLLLYAVGIVITINADIGYAPWDVFHVGFSNTFGMSIGMASIITGLAIGAIAVILGEKIGIGTVLNMVMIGVFVDWIMLAGFIPIATNFFTGAVMMIVGIIIISLATYFYISAAFGSGPRDSLMVAVTRKTRLPVGFCRGSIELIAVIIGWQLGGKVGVGTILFALFIGLFVQTTFKVLHFDATQVSHETLDQTLLALTRKTNN
ncbi:MAG: hypothetical protein K8R73_04810 [Clostridiales bacterium]|nr:hypothetical protein [Clostridiales bacterium]